MRLHSAGSCSDTATTQLSASAPTSAAKSGNGVTEGGVPPDPRLPDPSATSQRTCRWMCGKWSLPQDSAVEMLQKFTECKKLRSLKPGICRTKLVPSETLKANLFIWNFCLRNEFSQHEGESEWIQDHLSHSRSESH